MGARFASIQHCIGPGGGGWGVGGGEPGIYIGKVKVLVAQSCPTLGDSMDCGPPGSSVHRILQTIVESGNLPDPGIEPGSPALQADFFPI